MRACAPKATVSRSGQSKLYAPPTGPSANSAPSPAASVSLGKPLRFAVSDSCIGRVFAAFLLPSALDVCIPSPLPPLPCADLDALARRLKSRDLLNEFAPFR